MKNSQLDTTAFLLGFHQKMAGYKSEIGGTAMGMLPFVGIPWAIGNTIGAGIGALTPTRSPEEQLAAEEDGALNFIPGVAGYNAAKRLGAQQTMFRQLMDERERGV